jgi:dipeptidyl aminopeptidase/acylaminoacyl peptidase
LLDQVSPVRAIPAVRARVILVHGYGDRAVPYTESLRLAAARPARTRVVLLQAVGHVEAEPGSLWRAAHDGVRLLLAFHALRHAG